MTRAEVTTASGTTGLLGGGRPDILPSSRSAFVAIALVGAGLALLPIWIGGSRTFMGLAIDGLLFACYAVAFNLIFGSTGQLFLCVGALAGVGGYGSVILAERVGVPFVLAMVLAGGLSMLLGATFSWIAVRRSLDVIFTGIVTLAFALGFQNLLLGQRDLTGGETGMVIETASDTILGERVPPYYVFLGLLLAYLVVYLLLQRSHAGWAFRALRDDEVAAELAGVDVARYRIYAGMVGSLMLGLAGGLFAHVEGFIGPSTFQFAHVDVTVIVMLGFGGIGTLLGPVVGAGVFTVLDDYLASFTQLRVVMYGALLLILFLGFPQGVVRAVASGVRRVMGNRAG